MAILNSNTLIYIFILIPRLPQEVYQTAKLAKHLLKSQNEEIYIENLTEELITDDEPDEDDINTSKNMDQHSTGN